jgi:hypothetical protein
MLAHAATPVTEVLLRRPLEFSLGTVVAVVHGLAGQSCVVASSNAQGVDDESGPEGDLQSSGRQPGGSR